MKKMLKRKLTSLVVLVLIVQASLLTPFIAFKTETRAQEALAVETDSESIQEVSAEELSEEIVDETIPDNAAAIAAVPDVLTGITDEKEAVVAFSEPEDSEEDGIEDYQTRGPPTDFFLAFTSDVHNESNNQSADRLGQWIEIVQKMYGSIDYMGFCGDMADANGRSNYWYYTQAVMDVVSSNRIPACYTTGNHEYSHNDVASSYYYDLNDTTLQFTVDSAPFNLPEDANYSIYALGSMSSSQEYTDDQINNLNSFLTNADPAKPIIVLAHFPLHYAYSTRYGSRTTGNSDQVINVLNSAADSGKTIIFLWGHNHTLADSGESNYDRIFTPGERIRYSSNGQRSIGFYYAAAGCMSDYPYSTGSATVGGKGLVIQVRADRKIGFAYYDAEGNDVTKSGDYPKIEYSGEYVWSEPTWNWSDDLTTATATFTYSNGFTSYTEIVEAEITKDETAVGLIPYTATVEFNGETFKDIKIFDFSVNISLELEDGIILHIYAEDLPEGTEPSDYTIYYNDVYGKPYKEVLTDLTENQFSVDVDSPEMTQKVNIEIWYKDTIVYSNYASVQKYCDKVIDDEDAAKDLVELCYAILNYGTKAQKQFNKHLDDLANANHPDLPFELQEVPETLTQKTIDETKITKSTMSLRLQYQTEVFFYFTPANGVSAEDLSAEVWKDGVLLAGDEFEYGVASDGRLLVKVKHIKAIDLADTITVIISAEGEQIGEIVASPIAYLYLARNVSSLSDLSSAMYQYFLKTVQFFNNNH